MCSYAVEQTKLGGPVWKAPFLTGFWVPKMAPKILQVDLTFHAVFATLGKPGGACRAAESMQKSSPRRQQSGFGALDISQQGQECCDLEPPNLSSPLTESAEHYGPWEPEDSG